MIVVSARVKLKFWGKIKGMLRTKTNQETVTKLSEEYYRLWKENQDLRLKLSASRLKNKKI